MDSTQDNELNELRDQLNQWSSWDISNLLGLFSDYLHNRWLCDNLLNDPFIETVLYCKTNKNDDREKKIAYLYPFFKNKGYTDNISLYLISIALYLSGIDATLSTVSKPNIKEEDLNHGNGTSGGETNNGGISNPPKNEGGNGKNTGDNGTKKGLKFVGVCAVILLLIGALKLFSKPNDNEQIDQSTFDICRTYEGLINSGGEEKHCNISIHHTGGNNLHIVVTNTYNANDRLELDGYIKKGHLNLSNGPSLQIETTQSGKYTLSGDNTEYGTWTFVSK